MCHGPKGWGPNLEKIGTRRVGAPEGGAPKAGATRVGAEPRKKWDPEEWAPKGGAPKGGAPKGGAELWEAPNFAFFFFVSRLSLGVLSWFFGGVWKRRGRQMCTFGLSAVV